MEEEQVLSPKAMSVVKKNYPKHAAITKLICDGEEMNTKGKFDNCICAITSHGLYIYKTSGLSSTCKIKHFISIKNLKKMEYINENTRSFHQKYGNVITIRSTNIKQLEKSYVNFYQVINFQSPKKYEFEFVNYPQNQLPIYEISDRPARLPLIRYIAICAACDTQNEQSHLRIFTGFSKGMRSTLTLDSSVVEPICADIIAYPLYSETNLTNLYLDNFAPNTITRIIEKIMKHSTSIKSITFTNYANLSDNQFNLLHIENPSISSWTFINCFPNADKFLQYFTAFALYNGTLQQLAIDGAEMTANVMKKVTTIIKSARCFRSLEILEFDHLDVKTKKEAAEIFTLLEKTAKVLPKLRVFNCRKWSTPIQRPSIQLGRPYRILDVDCVAHAGLGSFDMTEVLGYFQISKNLSTLNFAGGKFKPPSLQALIRSVAQLKRPISLNLSSLKMRSKDWTEFFSLLDSTEKINELHEIHWDSNPLPTGTGKNFAKVFLPKSLKYLSMNYVFDCNANTSEFDPIGAALANTELYGISLAGTPKKHIGDTLLDYIEKLRHVKTLEYMDIRGVHMTEDGLKSLLDSIRFLKMLHELRLDDAGVPNRGVFYIFYGRLWQSSTIQSMNFPIGEFERLVPEDIRGAEIVSPNYTQNFERLMTKSHISTNLCRAEFWRRNRPMSEVMQWNKTFPISLVSPPAEDPMQMFDWSQKTLPQRSLCDDEWLPTNDFTERQRASMGSVFDPPKEAAPLQMAVPARLRRFFGAEAITIDHIVFDEERSGEQPEIRPEFLRMYSSMIKPETLSLMEYAEKISKGFAAKAGPSPIISMVPISPAPEVVSVPEMMLLRQEIMRSSSLASGNTSTINTLDTMNSDEVMMMSTLNSRRPLLRRESFSTVITKLPPPEVVVEDPYLTSYDAQIMEDISKDADKNVKKYLKSLRDIGSKVYDKKLKVEPLAIDTYAIPPKIIDVELSEILEKVEKEETKKPTDKSEFDFKFEEAPAEVIKILPTPTTFDQIDPSPLSPIASPVITGISIPAFNPAPIAIPPLDINEQPTQKPLQPINDIPPPSLTPITLPDVEQLQPIPESLTQSVDSLHKSNVVGSIFINPPMAIETIKESSGSESSKRLSASNRSVSQTSIPPMRSGIRFEEGAATSSIPLESGSDSYVSIVSEAFDVKPPPLNITIDSSDSDMATGAAQIIASIPVTAIKPPQLEEDGQMRLGMVGAPISSAIFDLSPDDEDTVPPLILDTEQKPFELPKVTGTMAQLAGGIPEVPTSNHPALPTVNLNIPPMVIGEKKTFKLPELPDGNVKLNIKNNDPPTVLSTIPSIGTSPSIEIPPMVIGESKAFKLPDLPPTSKPAPIKDTLDIPPIVLGEKKEFKLPEFPSSNRPAVSGHIEIPPMVTPQPCAGGISIPPIVIGEQKSFRLPELPKGVDTLQSDIPAVPSSNHPSVKSPLNIPPIVASPEGGIDIPPMVLGESKSFKLPDLPPMSPSMNLKSDIPDVPSSNHPGLPGQLNIPPLVPTPTKGDGLNIPPMVMKESQAFNFKGMPGTPPHDLKSDIPDVPSSNHPGMPGKLNIPPMVVKERKEFDIPPIASGSVQLKLKDEVPEVPLSNHPGLSRATLNVQSGAPSSRYELPPISSTDPSSNSSNMEGAELKIRAPEPVIRPPLPPGGGVTLKGLPGMPDLVIPPAHGGSALDALKAMRELPAVPGSNNVKDPDVPKNIDPKLLLVPPRSPHNEDLTMPTIKSVETESGLDDDDVPPLNFGGSAGGGFKLPPMPLGGGLSLKLKDEVPEVPVSNNPQPSKTRGFVLPEPPMLETIESIPISEHEPIKIGAPNGLMLPSIDDDDDTEFRIQSPGSPEK